MRFCFENIFSQTESLQIESILFSLKFKEIKVLIQRGLIQS